LFGTKDCDEKFCAPRSLLESVGVELLTVDSAETTASCSDGACKIIEWGDSERAAAVISSYAAPLLEGCGTIKKGDLRIVGETQPVPFITAFTTDRVDREFQKKIARALLDVGKSAELKEALETLTGFVGINDDYRTLRKALRPEHEESTNEPTKKSGNSPATQAQEPASKDSANSNGWPQWRGPTRDGLVKSLPSTLPERPAIVWRQPLSRPGLGGIAATDKYVILGDRDFTNKFDEFRCYQAKDGELLWTVQYPAIGQLDYDNTPRATPLIHGEYVYLLGAFGDLTCVELESGLSIWRTNVIAQFGGDKELIWGTSSSPLITDGKLIVNPGGKDASIVALDLKTGDVIWQTPGGRHAYASFIVGEFGGVRQLVGYDQTTLGGWDVATGRRLWTLKPPHDGDFNVPTPIAVHGKLLVTTENNFTRLYGFDEDGHVIAEPLAVNEQLAPDISTPVVVGTRLFCVSDHLFCLDVANGLNPLWIGDDNAFGDYSPLIASDNRLLAIGLGGELILVDPQADKLQIIARQALFDDARSKHTQLLSHPALVGTRLYLRGENELVCAELAPHGP
jgi:hypothetical protein